MAPKLAALAVGVVFGITLSWSQLSDPQVIRDALLFREAYLFLFFASAVATSFAGLRIIRALRSRAVLVDRPVAWEPERPQRRHLVGSVLFGIGWAVAGACPGPVATQLGQGVWWGLCTAAGLAGGVALYLRRHPQAREAGQSASVATESDAAVSPGARAAA
jgi:uncharacterized membrane protein YedE/YeeE